jgi:hypothetical protein
MDGDLPSQALPIGDLSSAASAFRASWVPLALTSDVSAEPASVRGDIAFLPHFFSTCRVPWSVRVHLLTLALEDPSGTVPASDYSATPQVQGVTDYYNINPIWLGAGGQYTTDANGTIQRAWQWLF